MRGIVFSLLFLTFMLSPKPVQAQEQVLPLITSPVEGQIVQGYLLVSGTVSALGFSSYELSFAYNDDPTQTWFVLATGSQPVFEGELGVWDTSTLTDGDYNLRLRTFMLDGSVQETIVTGLRVRNYTSVPTSTFTPTSTAIVQFAVPTAQLVGSAPATVAPALSTPTPIPPNPASLHENAISDALGQGAILALLLFIIFGLLLRLRRD